MPDWLRCDAVERAGLSIRSSTDVPISEILHLASGGWRREGKRFESTA